MASEPLSCDSGYYDLQRFIRDPNLQWCLNPHLSIEGRILWVPTRGNGHSSCLKIMDAGGHARQLRRVARRRGFVYSSGPWWDVSLQLKELS